MVCSSVNIFEILYASTYGNYNYIYKVKKMPRLVCGHQPLRATAARFTLTRNTSIVIQYKTEGKLSPCFFIYIYYNRARAGVAAARVAKMAISQGCHSWHFLKPYICNYICHRYLHAKFQKY